MRAPGPLWWRSALRLLHGGPWGLLVVGAFVLLGAAAAVSAPFTEAAANAGLSSVLATVPGDAAADQAPIVRVVGGSISPRAEDQRATAARLAAIPGLGPVSISGVSIGAELAPGRLFTSTVSAGGRSVDVRLAAVEDPATQLVPAAPRVGSGREAQGIWLPAPVARDLGVAPGAALTLTVTRPAGSERVPTTLAGTYAVEGHVPADAAGSAFWASRRGELPTTGLYALTPAWLAVAPVPVAQQLADESRDRILWAVQAAPAPGTATLEEYRGLAAAVDAVRLQVLDPARGGLTSGVLRATVASGIEDITARADAVAQATQARVDTLGRAALALAGVVVAAAVLLGLARRRSELQLAVVLGLGPARVAGVAAVEHAPAAVIGAPAGLLLAAGLVVLAGPPGRVTAGSVVAAAVAAGVTMAATVLAVALLWAGAYLGARRRRRERLRRPVPWEALLGVAAATATVGLVTTTDQGGPQGPLALLVPLLLTAAVGAVGGRLAVLALGRVLGHRPPRLPATTPGTGPDLGAREAGAASRRAARWLALRRLAAPSRERSAVVAVLATGAGLLLFAEAGARSTAVTIDDRVAVSAGAAATAPVHGSWVLDPGAPSRPKDGEVPAGNDPGVVPGVRTPPLTPGQAVVWRTRVGDPAAFGSLDLLVVDPATFVRAAQWGSGSELARARELVERLADADARTLPALQRHEDLPVPVIAVGYPAVPPGGRFGIVPGETPVVVQVLGSADAFPGLHGLPMLVAPASSLFRALPFDDPRPRSKPGGPPQTFPEVRLWSALGADDVARTLVGAAEGDAQIATADALRHSPELEAAHQALRYQEALGWCAALVSLVAFALYVDRAVSLAAAADLLLALVGLGGAGVRRARVLEPVAMAVLSGVLALAAVVLLRPLAGRLLDPQRAATPPFVLDLDRRTLLAAGVFVVVAAGVAASAAIARHRSLTPDRTLRDA